VVNIPETDQTRKDIDMTVSAHGKLVRQALGLPAKATEAEVQAACNGRSTAEVCDAVSCHCVAKLADGTPGITPDVPLAMLSAHDVVKVAPPAGCSNEACCQNAGSATQRRGHIMSSSLALFADLDRHQKRASKDKK
jgi:hypothetical protein